MNRTPTSRLALLASASFSAFTFAATPSRAQSVQSLDQITVVATKTPETVVSALAGASSVTRDQIDQLMPGRLSDIFFGVPSISFGQRGDDPATSINLRGLQDFGRVAVTIDGARQNFQQTGHNGAGGTFYLDPELLAGVDIVRGPVSNINGSGAIGGVVSFRTKDVDDVLNPGEKWGFLGAGMIGSNMGRGLGSLFTAARISPNAEVFAGALYRGQTDYQDGAGHEVPNSAFSDWASIAKITLRPAEGHEIKLSAIFQEFNYTVGQLASSESGYQTQLQNDIVTAKWKYARPDDMWFNIDATVYWTRTDSQQTKTFGTPDSEFATGPVGNTRTNTIDTLGFDINNTTRFETGPLRNAVTYGVDLFHDRVHVTDPGGTADLFTPSGERTVDGAFVQWKTNYSSWLEVIAAARYDSYRLEGGGTSSDGDRISPKITVGITPINWLTFYGTYAEGYRAPAITETLVAGAHPPPGGGFPFPNLFTFVPNPDLRPEVGHNKEVGINIKYDDLFIAGDKLRAKFNVFRNDIDDYITLVSAGESATVVPVCFAPPGFCPNPVPFFPYRSPLEQYQNIGNARIEGIEFESTYDAGKWFAGLSASHLRGRDKQTGDPLLTIAPDQVAMLAGARFFDRKLTIAVRWTAVAAKRASEIPDADGDGLPDVTPTKSYNLVNLYVGYSPTPDVTASFNVDNLLNEQYVRYLDAAQAVSSTIPVIYSPGITFKGNLRLRFGQMGT